MTKKPRNSVGARLRRLGAEKIVLPIGDGRPISWLTLQAVLFLIGCLICSCCSISSYIWGSVSPNITLPAPIHTSRPISTPHPTGAGASVETAVPSPHTQPPTQLPAMKATLQSSIPTPTLDSEPTSTPRQSPTRTTSPQPGPTPTGTPRPTPTSAPSPATGLSDLHIVHVEREPPEPEWDTEDALGEHVLIENRGDRDQDMTGWTLGNDQSDIYSFPAGFILPGGETVYVWTRSGTDTEFELYWGREKAVWANESGTAYLWDNTGALADSLEW